jgi:hypothetical protein
VTAAAPPWLRCHRCTAYGPGRRACLRRPPGAPAGTFAGAPVLLCRGCRARLRGQFAFAPAPPPAPEERP